ncbi:histidine kinase [Streptomyces griseorubiginosus]|uniref:histidine kinase n=1 Tax=Streptomyces griseorubiginosus TaxID=67304 RepID=UPI0036EBBD76
MRTRAEAAERTREEEARHRITAERMRIARDLHDAVAHHLLLANLQAGATRRGREDRRGAVRHHLVGGLTVTLTTEGAVRPLSAGTDLTAYRIVQEALPMSPSTRRSPRRRSGSPTDPTA